MRLRKTAQEAHRFYVTTARSWEHNIVMADLAIELQKIYDSEINCGLAGFGTPESIYGSVMKRTALRPRRRYVPWTKLFRGSKRRSPTSTQTPRTLPHCTPRRESVV